MPSRAAFRVVDEVEGDPAELQVYEHGWQSWSPTGLYPATATSARPRLERWQTMAFRPDRPAPPAGFQGEGLLAVVQPDGAATLWAAPRPTVAVPSIRAAVVDARLVVSADVEVERHDEPGPAGLVTALETWADRHAPGELRPLGTGWCSWYCHWGAVTAADISAAVVAIDRLDLPIDVVQVDDGYQSEIGDWTEWSPRFGSLAETVSRINLEGRRAGVWTAPFMVGNRSRVAIDRPELLVGGAEAAEEHWEQRVGVLDVTHPDGEAHLRDVFTTLRELGVTYFKCDFVYAGAMEGRRHGDADGIAAYRHGLSIIRDAIGPESTLLGCGAPLLASIGLVDAMRVSPDIGPHYEPILGDLSQPAGRSAMNVERARRWQHGRWWINDPDCLLVRDEVERRDEWMDHVAASGGLVVSSDALDQLGDHEVELLRANLRQTVPEPVPWEPTAPEGPW
ncbi:MAG: glycoside hydrolase family 36 protein [Ilumatobacteraceae bacterium]